MTVNHDWLRTCETSRLNSLLAEADKLDANTQETHAADLAAIRAEKDRRLSDSNSPDFRPDFF